MMSIPLSWSSSFRLCAEKWVFLTPLSKARPVLELLFTRRLVICRFPLWFPLLTFLHQTAAVLALTEVRGEDKGDLAKLVTAVKEGYLEKYEESKRHWGGGIMGAKANAKIGKFSPHRWFHLATNLLTWILPHCSQETKGVGCSHQDLTVSLLFMCKITIKISWVPFFNRGVSGNSEKSQISFISFSSVNFSFSFFSQDKY